MQLCVRCALIMDHGCFRFSGLVADDPRDMTEEELEALDAYEQELRLAAPEPCSEHEWAPLYWVRAKDETHPDDVLKLLEEARSS